MDIHQFYMLLLILWIWEAPQLDKQTLLLTIDNCKVTVILLITFIINVLTFKKGGFDPRVDPLD